MPVEKEIRENLVDIKKIYKWVKEEEIDEKIADFLKSSEVVYFIGCGSSHYISIIASRYLTGVTGLESKNIPAGEILFAFDQSVSKYGNKTAVLMSRSGETTETVKAAKVLRDAGIKSVGITIEKDSSLEKAVDLPIVVPIKEESIVMTKSFNAIALMLQMVAEKMAGVDKSGIYEEILKNLENIMKESERSAADFADGNRYVFLGVGPYEGVAREAALKLEEMSLTVVEALSTFEYRHGPKSLVDEDVNIVIYTDGKEERKLADELKAYGGKVILRKKLSENFEDSFVQTIFAQFLGLEIAKRKGVDVENPRHLTKVVKI